MSIAKPTDEELDELFFISTRNCGKVAAARMPEIEPIRLSDVELDRSMTGLGSIPDAGRRHRVRKELAEATEFFCTDYALQQFPSPSETARRFATIQVAARRLIRALEPHGSIPSDIQSYLQISADAYGSMIGRRSSEDIPWNFWSAYKLPSVISGVRLIDHWAGLAREELARSIARNKGARHTGYRGKTAVRVLVHRLALSWLHAHGKAPGAGFHPYKLVADGPFIRFAFEFIKAIKKNLTDAQRTHCSGIDQALSVTQDAIRSHLLVFKRRLAGKVKSKPGTR